MLKPEIDVEIIKSSLLAGEVDDTVAWIKGAMDRIVVYRRVTKKDKYDARYRFLEALMDYLEGKLGSSSFREAVNRIPDIRSAFVPVEEYKDFMDSFTYYVQLAVDRYNIRYPDFDGKRCDDK